jgi:site-specific recombinase XerD
MEIGRLEPLPTEPDLPEEAVSGADQSSVQAQPLPTPASGTTSNSTRKGEAGHRALITIEQAIAAYVQEMGARGRDPKTLQWHQTSLGALRRYLWRQFQLADIGSLTGVCLQAWVSDLPFVLSARTGATRTISTVAAYARSARAFCNWLARQGYVSETPFPKGLVPKARRGLPQAVESEAFVRLLRACQLPGSPGGKNAGMTARNRAILWLLLDSGLQVSELCGLRLADVDRVRGTVTVRGKGGRPRTLPLSADGQRAVGVYLHQARLTPAWEPAVPEARDRLLLTERGHPFTKNSLALLFKRLSRRAGFTRTPICSCSCVPRTARSQMAEALLRHLSHGTVEAFSAGSRPAAELHPLARRCMERLGIDTSRAVPKHFEVYRGQRFDVIVTVCDRVLETCPTFPDDPERIHWSFLDPATVQGSEAEQLRAFEQISLQLTTRIRFLLTLLQRKHSTREP